MLKPILPITAIKRSVTVALMLLPTILGSVLAAPVGEVTHTSGALFALRGKQQMALNQNSSIESGDTVITEKTTYARLKFIDHSEVTLRPNTTFVVHKLQFQTDKPQQDAAQLGLIKGGLRTLTGLIGKRSSPDSYQMQTPTATIGIRGTDYQLSHDGTELRVSVNEGHILVETPQHQLDVLAGEAALVRAPGAPIERIPNPPEHPAVPFTPPPEITPVIGTPRAPTLPTDDPSSTLSCQVR